jgi:hypothetical protein
MTTTKNPRQGILGFDLDDTPPPSLLEDPDLDLGDLATVGFVDRGQEVK